MINPIANYPNYHLEADLLELEIDSATKNEILELYGVYLAFEEKRAKLLRRIACSLCAGKPQRPLSHYPRILDVLLGCGR